MPVTATLEEIVRQLTSGSLKLHETDEATGDSNLATQARRKALEQMLGLDLSDFEDDLDYNQVVGRNCENTIGSIRVPIGIAGPIQVQGSHAAGSFYVPMATTEGALVASVNRGMTAIRNSGGAVAMVLEDKMTRAPVFKTPGLREAVTLVNWVESNLERIKEVFESSTRHGKLLRIRPFVVGRNVFLRFEASSGDAMGMNMVVKSTNDVAKFIETELPWAKTVSLSGNMCTDKKAAATNWILGRGKSVVAESVINADVVSSVLKTTPENIAEVALRKLYLGGARAGVHGGFNAHAANILSAIFIATGQDPAQLVESSGCITYCETTEDRGLYISVTLPTLEVGTVGGGTSLPTQRKALQILGVAGSGNPPGLNAVRFAEIIAAAVLAGELSLLAALAAHHLADSHMRLGRKARS